MPSSCAIASALNVIDGSATHDVSQTSEAAKRISPTSLIIWQFYFAWLDAMPEILVQFQNVIIREDHRDI